MNCTVVRAQLALFVYGDLSAGETEQIADHLHLCRACATEVEALRRLRGCLDAAPAPMVNVNLAKLYQTASEREQRRIRRWRRLAIAATSVAAAIVIGILAANLRFAWQDGQLTIAWGALSVPQVAEPPVNPAPAPADDVRAAEFDRRLQTLTEIVHSLAANVDARDQRQQADVADLRGGFQVLRQEILRLRAATLRGSPAMENAFVRVEKGDIR
jgi:hypothetical protein